MATGTKQRMIESAAELLREKGLTGMSFTDVTARSGAPRGVIYHHFPNGKVELVRDAVRWTGGSVLAGIGHLDADTPAGLVEQFLGAIRHVLAESALGSSCAVAAVTLGTTVAGESPATDAQAALVSWIDALAQALERLGTPADRAADVAATLVVVLQGSHVLTRATGSLETFDRVARVVRQAAAGALGARWWPSAGTP